MSAANSKAQVEIDAPEELLIGENIITVTVTSENGEERAYILKVFKKENVENNDQDSVVDTIQPQEKCNHTGYIVAIIIESIALVGLLGYIIYDKKIKK